mgnify:CR=1 FL=1
MRRIAIFFLICPEERSIIAESGLIAGFCDGGAPAQELVCVLEAFFGQVFGNGVAGFLAEETHHVVFAHVKAGGELVDRMVFFWVFREVAHEFQDFLRRKGRSERIPDGFRRRRDQGVP